ncbi:cobalamin-binding protein [Fodinibius halophilus]|uniref:Cobalamin-binding protein n=1 Tax=Fodinibius halophilus TaxID=1736908 RepID=A0A6M1T612_9BACT|nr:cobalamin-binding protein [Fodinibius halophilus]NGP89547.1 cobalamin-binding protein [Fodinibius halophilus]
MRIVSLLPSTTEIVAALGKSDQLVGRSHECDFPEGISDLPACTEPKFNPDGTSYQIDQRVKALLQEGLSVYRVDQEKLEALKPDIVITQDHCEVCAVSLDDVKEAVRSYVGDHVEVVSVSPTDLSSVVASIRTIAEAIDASDQAEMVMQSMKSDLQQIQQKTAKLHHPDILAIEWLDPFMAAGNWVPELIQLAGGRPLGAEAGKHSPWLEWESIRRWNPDIITIIPCGYDIEESLSELSNLTSQDGWQGLDAVRNNQVYVADGNQYFNRPGPRLVDSTRILAEIMHPGFFSKSNSDSSRWINLAKHQFHQSIKKI